MNPNGAVIYTTNADVAQTNVSRRLPIESVLSGVWINQTITGVSTNATFTNGSAVDASTIAQAIENYIRTNAPLRMPAEICNVPEIADLRATNNPTRNDLVRQVVGALTTQGNVFSVWTVGQAVNKKPANTQYDEFEPGDNVLAEVRLRFIIERYLILVRTTSTETVASPELTVSSERTTIRWIPAVILSSPGICTAF